MGKKEKIKEEETKLATQPDVEMASGSAQNLTCLLDTRAFTRLRSEGWSCWGKAHPVI